MSKDTITYSLENQFPLEMVWNTVWETSANCTTIEELVRTLNRYRKNNPEVLYRIVKHEVIS